MAWVKINGVSSDTITGLLIQTLPPISLPMMRTEIEEIDGRDGDIVTELGYAAYDKQITIGLHGNYDINQIVKFFSGSGTVIFSNEPDKYYNFRIMAQVDYTKLRKFKTATVTFHVQPYKYRVGEAYDYDPQATQNQIRLSETQYTTAGGLTVTSNGETIRIQGSQSGVGETFSVNIADGQQIYAPKYVVVVNAVGSVSGTDLNNILLAVTTSSGGNPLGGSYITAAQTMITGTNIVDGESLQSIQFETGDCPDPSDPIVYDVTLSFNGYQYLSSGELELTNDGNTDGIPVISVTGVGTVSFDINGETAFTVAFGSTSREVIVNAQKMNAYYSDGTYANRIVTGDYANIKFHAGLNRFGWSTGSGSDVTHFAISNVSRWLG